MHPIIVGWIAQLHEQDLHAAAAAVRLAATAAPVPSRRVARMTKRLAQMCAAEADRVVAEAARLRHRTLGARDGVGGHFA